MKYLLSEKEYSALVSRKVDIATDETKKLQEFCTRVANELPIKWNWPGVDASTPWGCILTDQNNEWYCDSCPAQAVCPYEHKEWSK